MSDLFERLAQLSPEKRALLARRLAGDGAPAGPEPVAVVGMSCRFPGGCDSPEAFWSLLTRRVDAITEVPRDRWNTDELYDADPAAIGKIATKWGGFLDGIDRFDPYVFGISPREAARMDPQQRLWLEVAWEAFERAGLTLEALAGSQTGVFLGLHSHSSDYFWLQLADPAQMDAFTGPGNAHNIAAGRLAYLLDLRGPALTIDTACSSSLVATHMACQSLRAGDCRVALVGGVNLMLSPLWSIPLSRMQMLSPTGRCRAFDADADGFVRSEGAGAVVLKRLSHAIADGDPVLAVIRGSAVNQDGRTNGITAPNGLAQRALLRAALENARVAAADVTQVEAHGTGTALGDPIEFEAIAEVLGDGRPADRPCWVTGVKSNFGHLEGAAGIAGLIKVVLSLQHRSIPPVVHFTKLNPHISVDARRFPVPTETQPWTSTAPSLVAGVSSFGWSGTNAHVIVEAAPQKPAAEGAEETIEPVLVLPISARTSEALRAQADRYRQFCASGAAGAGAAALCKTAAVRRTHHEHRLAIVGDSIAEFEERLRGFVEQQGDWKAIAGQTRGGRKPGVVFVFTGQGPQWPGMGLDLMAHVPAAGNIVERAETIIRNIAGWSVIEALAADGGGSPLSRTEFAQPAIFVVQAAIASALESWGVVPSAVIGHSLGEIAAAWSAGALSLQDALRVAVTRGRLMDRAAAQLHGRMVSVERPVEWIGEVVSDWRGLSIAAMNAPSSTVLSGDADAIAAVVATLTDAGAETRYLPVDYAFHSEQMARAAVDLEAALVGLSPSAAKAPIVSSVTGKITAGEEFTASYWRRNVRETVRFADAIAAVAAQQPVFLEIGPHPALRHAIASAASVAGTPLVAHTLHRGREGYGAIRASLGMLFAAGYPLDWERLMPGRVEAAALPTYAWQRERFWLDHVKPYTSAGLRRASSEQPEHAGAQDVLYTSEWTIQRPAATRSESGACLVLGWPGGIAAELAQEVSRAGREATVIPAAGAAFSAIAAGKSRARDIVLIVPPAAAGAALQHEGVVDAQTESTALVLDALRAIASAPQPAPRLWLVTRGVHGDHANADSVRQAPVWGLARTLAIEYPAIETRCIDIVDMPSAAAALAAEIGAPTDEHEIVLAKDGRMVRRLVRCGDAQGTVNVRPDASYLITGGLGAIGLATVEWLVAKGAKRVVLTGRTPPKDDARARIAQLTAAGAEIEFVRADVSRASDVTHLFDSLASHALPLRGIVHSAGVLDDGVALEQTRERFRTVLAPKVAGAWNLHTASAGLPLDFFVVYSSIASLLGSAGQANYAAANAALDAFARMRNALGLPSTSVNWGTWSDGGMAASLDEASQRRLAQAGFEPLSRAVAFAALDRAVGCRRPEIAIAGVDWARYEKYRGTPLPLLAALIDAKAAPAEAKAALIAALEAAPAERHRTTIQQHVRRDVLTVLGVPAGHPLDDEQGLRDAGLDSLMALELKNRLQHSTARTLPATLAFDYPTIAALTDYLFDVLARPAAAVPAATEEPTAASDLESLSEEEAAALLAEEIAALRNGRAASPGYPRG